MDAGGGGGGGGWGRQVINVAVTVAVAAACIVSIGLPVGAADDRHVTLAALRRQVACRGSVKCSATGRH